MGAEDLNAPNEETPVDDVVESVAEQPATDEPADPSEDNAEVGTQEPASVEDLVVALETVAGERDQYLDSWRRMQAEFENYRKAVAKREADARERANEGLVADLLPVLDACDGAVANGVEGVQPIYALLLEALTKQGLAPINDADVPFDPESHEAVMHQPGDEDSGPVVSQVLRVGYSWRGRTLRAAMVQVSG